jgi:hypothetical protein
MCDTISTGPKWSKQGFSYFAKNSDREPGEPQILQFVRFDNSELINISNEALKRNYVDSSFRYLEQAIDSDLFNNYRNYSAIISSPLWMWGAEMGVNEKGLSIGNEAVFSKRAKRDEGLLDMDILRLALHQCATAEEAVNYITRLIERFGQGGDGGYKHSLYYDNAFLIQDKNEGWIIESSARKWCARKSGSMASISNTYSLEDRYDRSNLPADSKGLKHEKENKVMNFLAAGELRNQYKIEYLNRTSGSGNLHKIKGLLRSHISRSDKTKRGMRSICIHNLPPFNSQTTASFIVEYRPDDFRIWYTGSDLPCRSIYKPLIFDEKLFIELKLNNRKYGQSIYKKRQIAVKTIGKASSSVKKKILIRRDELEDLFYKILDEALENREDVQKAILLCHRQEEEFFNSVFQLYSSNRIS